MASGARTGSTAANTIVAAADGQHIAVVDTIEGLGVEGIACDLPVSISVSRRHMYLQERLTKHNDSLHSTDTLAAESIVDYTRALRIPRQHDRRIRTPGLNRVDFVRHVASTSGTTVKVTRSVGRIVDALECEAVGAKVAEQGKEHGRPDDSADVAAFRLYGQRSQLIVFSI